MTDETPHGPAPDDAPLDADETWRADLKAKARRPRRWLKWLALSLAAVCLLAAGAAAGGWFYVKNTYLADLPDIPDKEELYKTKRAPGIRYLDRRGELIAERGPRFGDRVALSQLPDHVVKAFLAAEDARFYEHGALDYQGLVRAAWVNWRAGRVVQGGSTLTQQLVKDLFLTPERSLKRKIQEAAIAYRVEEKLSKNEILELYLNRLFFGANTFGVDGAARTYFGKPASQLTLGEAALLASLPKAPSKLALNKDMSGAMARGRRILANMAEEGWIAPEQAREALAEPPKLAERPAGEGDYGYVLDYATAEAVRLVGDDAPSLIVRLSIDPQMQTTAAQTLREVVAAQGRSSGATQGALVALANDGAIRAMVGGLDYAESPFNRALQARRQPGSTFKPFVYAAALEAGAMPTDVRLDEAVKIGDWNPENYGGSYAGPVTLETALAKSINTVAVQVAQETGADQVAVLARRFGLSSIPDRPNLSVALGAYEVTLLELTNGFSVFAKGGYVTQPYLIEEITSPLGQQLYVRAPSTPAFAYDSVRAGQMVRMLRKVVTSGTGTRAAFDWPAAGKTGTSQEWRDAWFIGFTPELTAGVWLGDDGGRPMRQVTGGELPAEIWRRFMVAAHQGLVPRDFDWLPPEPEPEVVASERAAFYDTLSADFTQAAALAAPEAALAEEGLYRPESVAIFPPRHAEPAREPDRWEIEPPER
ncbi:MAG: PBP1A family penicillin-binding protein [Phenylobacterium sp.]|uniref:multimodular transpeptidase-transglycosylase PbpC n=1 Tax=Phenylobacterium sp. TaxID=1871053 RepID=UPI002A3671BE|nr:PBP1A family penicillin-binding protein [Phenylobacterium sp.]MDX9997027.1 PBP1A family penicillin-binding protein [Phenylobacterium sp.]